MASTARTIVFAQRKGGVGKTTLAICVAAELSVRGHKVTLVDADPQGSACSWAELGQLPYSVWDIPFTTGYEEPWREALSEPAAESDLIVIDSAPNEASLRAAVGVAGSVVVPCTPSGLDIAATKQTLAVIGEERRRRERGPKAIIVPNRVDRRTLEGQQCAEELRRFGELVSPAIGSRSAFVRAFTTGVAVCDFDSGSIADQEIQMLCSFVELSILADQLSR